MRKQLLENLNVSFLEQQFEHLTLPAGPLSDSLVHTPLRSSGPIVILHVICCLSFRALPSSPCISFLSLVVVISNEVPLPGFQLLTIALFTIICLS